MTLDLASNIATSLISYWRDGGYNDEIMAMSYDGIEIPASVFINGDIDYFREMNKDALAYTTCDHDIIFAFQALTLEPQSFFNVAGRHVELAHIVHEAISHVMRNLGLPPLFSVDEVLEWRCGSVSPIDKPAVFMKLAPYMNNVQNKKRKH